MSTPQEQSQPRDQQDTNSSKVDQQNFLERISGAEPTEEEQVVSHGEITNNDGSVVETLDTAFHDKPGMIKSHSIAGSNRADYYEARADGKSDSEEELDYLKDS